MKTLNELVKDYGNYEVDEETLKKNMVKPKPKTIWDLKDGDKYWAINTEGNVFYGEWNNCKYDISIRNQGNVFLTKEEAEFEKKRREVYTTVKRYAHEFSKEEWNDTKINKYYACYNYKDHSIIKGFNSHVSNSKLYFQSIKDIDRAIAAVGVEDFKKYYLGVKE